ncbi:MAG: hypothetical protein WC393_05745 [Candidatus Nanoarchaeia archaeon]|jgi:hypothetical protein
MDENGQQGQKPMFKTIKSMEKEYGTRNFIEVALKETNDSENVFFSISKGFKTQNDMKRYKNSLGFAASEELQQFLVDAFKELIEAYKALPKKQSAPAETKAQAPVEVKAPETEVKVETTAPAETEKKE